MSLLHRCKTAVIKLDSKCYIVENEQAKSKDREVMDELLDKIATVKELLEADSNILPCTQESDESQSVDQAEKQLPAELKQHNTLKQSGVTRWNSILAMVESILCLWTE